MNVILCEDVDNLGEMGQTVKVAPGYARNYLLPRKLAVTAESGSAKQIAHEMGIIRRREEKRREELKKVANDLSGVIVEFDMRAGEGDKLYGSVTSAHVADRLNEMGYSISRRYLNISEPIKSLGVHEVPVRLPGGVETTIRVRVKKLAEVVPEEPTPEAPAPQAAAGQDVDTKAEETVQAEPGAPE